MFVRESWSKGNITHLPAIRPLDFAVLFICLLSCMKQGWHQQKQQRTALGIPENAGMWVVDLHFTLLLRGMARARCLSAGRAAEGAQQPLCSVLSSSIQCFHTSKNKISQNIVCLSWCPSTGLSPVTHKCFVFSFKAKGERKAGLKVIVLWC